jgi:hypothetical protein
MHDILTGNRGNIAPGCADLRLTSPRETPNCRPTAAATLSAPATSSGSSSGSTGVHPSLDQVRLAVDAAFLEGLSTSLLIGDLRMYA